MKLITPLLASLLGTPGIAGMMAAMSPKGGAGPKAKHYHLKRNPETDAEIALWNRMIDKSKREKHAAKLERRQHRHAAGMDSAMGRRALRA